MWAWRPTLTFAEFPGGKGSVLGKPLGRTNPLVIYRRVPKETMAFLSLVEVYSVSHEAVGHDEQRSAPNGQSYLSFWAFLYIPHQHRGKLPER